MHRYYYNLKATLGDFNSIFLLSTVINSVTDSEKNLDEMLDKHGVHDDYARCVFFNWANEYNFNQDVDNSSIEDIRLTLVDEIQL